MTETTHVEQSTTAQESVQTSSLSDMSLAEYRAQREGKQAAAAPESKPAQEPKTESAAEESTSGEDEGGTESPESTGDENQPAPNKKKGGFQRKLEAKDREIEDLKRQLAGKPAAPAAETKEAKPPQAEAPQFDKPKPKLEDFPSVEEHIEALTDWKAEERDWKRDQQAERAKQEQEAQKILNDWNSRKAAAQKEHADYDKALEAVADVKLSPAHQRLFLESEHGPELAYQLAKNPDELKRIAALSPLAAARAFGKLEASLSATTSQPETRVSKAPAPIRPVAARAPGSGTPDLSRMSLADYRRGRETGTIR